MIVKGEKRNFICVWKDFKPTPEDIVQILADHKAWLANEYPIGIYLEEPSTHTPHELSGANLSEAHLEEADLRYAHMVEAILTGAHMEKALLFRARLESSKLTQAHLEGTDLSQANLEKAHLSWADLRKTTFAQAQLKGAQLLRANMEGANFRAAHMHEAVLFDAHLRAARFREAHLVRAVFINTDLDGADFRGANLEGACLWGASLKKAFLTKARVSTADLTNAILEGADLRKANLSNANVTSVTYDRHMKCRGIRAETCFGSPMFKRHVQDLDFIEEFEATRKTWWQKWLCTLWRITSDYGRSFWRWAAWSAGIALAFGGMYAYPGFWTWRGYADEIVSLPKKLEPLGQVRVESWFTDFYYSIVTFTTLGFGDVTPTGPLGEILVTLEVILGYIMLGGLISILANKLARRS